MDEGVGGLGPAGDRQVAASARALVAALDLADPSWRQETLMRTGDAWDEVNDAWVALIRNLGEASESAGRTRPGANKPRAT